MQEKNRELEKRRITRQGRWQRFKLFLYVLPFLVLLFAFSYYPLYGWIYAFYDYRPPIRLSDSRYVGLLWFQTLVANPVKVRQILGVLTNTFALSGISILTSWLPMLYAVLLSEIRLPRFKRTVQVLTTIPNFISWILVYSLAFSLFSASGMVNNLLQSMGLTGQPILFLQSSEHVWLSMWLWGTWKGLGWGAILYFASISGIDQELYEAARVDGANRYHMIRHITIPCLLPTYFVLLLLSFANFFNNGFEQFFVFQNAFNKKRIEVLDLHVYNLGLGSGGYSLSTAISMLKSLVSVSLLLGINKLSKWLRGESLV